MVDPYAALTVARQRYEEMLCEAAGYRLARSMQRRPARPHRLRWAAADVLISTGQRLRGEDHGDGDRISHA
jgi:hypothetical protein